MTTPALPPQPNTEPFGNPLSLTGHWSRWFVPALALLSVLVLYAASQRNGMEISAGDQSMYLAHARNLAEGRPYAATNYHWVKELWFEGGATYPAGYPILLAPIYRLCGLNWRVLKFFTALLTVLGLAAVYLYSRKRVSSPQALVVALFFGLGYSIFSLRDTFNSESAYLLGSYSALWLLGRVYEERWNERHPWWCGYSMGLLLGFVYLTRSIGVSLFLAAACYEVLRYRRPTRFLLAMSATVLCLAMAGNRFLHHDSSYGDQFVFSVQILVRHLVEYLRLFVYVWINGFSFELRIFCWAAMIALAALAVLLRVWKRGPGLVEFYIAFYLGVLMVYHATNPRYSAMLAPLVLVYACEGMGTVARWAGRRWARAMRGAALAAVLATVAGALTMNDEMLGYNVESPAFAEVCRFARERTAPEAMFVFWDPRVFGLLGERQCAKTAERPPAEELAYLEQVKAGYVVYWKTLEPDLLYVRPMVNAFPRRFQTVLDNPEFTVYRFGAAPAQ
jgi:hypothetical protein